MLRPAGGGWKIRRIRIDAGDDTHPAPVAVREGGCVRRHPGGGAADGIHVHRRQRRRDRLAVSVVYRDGFVGDLLEEVDLPIPLQPLGNEYVRMARLSSLVGASAA